MIVNPFSVLSFFLLPLCLRVLVLKSGTEIFDRLILLEDSVDKKNPEINFISLLISGPWSF